MESESESELAGADKMQGTHSLFQDRNGPLSPETSGLCCNCGTDLRTSFPADRTGKRAILELGHCLRPVQHIFSR